MADRESKEAMDLVFGNMGFDNNPGDKSNQGGDDNDDFDDRVEDGDDVNDDGDDAGNDDGDLYNRAGQDGGGDDDDDDDGVVNHNRQEDDDDQDSLPRARQDKHGNIVDRNGKILARKGAETRLWRKAYRNQQIAQRAAADVADGRRRLNEAIRIGESLIAQVEELQQQVDSGNGTGRELGLSASEQVEALQLFALGKTNPGDLLKKVLTRAATSGIDVKSLGLQGGIDVKSLTEQIRADLQKELGPVKELTQQQRTAREQEARREEVYERELGKVKGFFRDNPQAVPFANIFNKLYQDDRFKGMPIEHAWSRIQLFMIRKGYMDTNGRVVRRNPQGQRSIPRGQRGDRRQTSGRPDFAADLTASYDDILKDVMKKSRYRA